MEWNQDQIKKINNHSVGKYGKDYRRIKFDSDDKGYPQIFSDDCLCEMLEHDRINISEGIDVNKSNLSLTKTHQKKDPKHKKHIRKITMLKIYHSCIMGYKDATGILTDDRCVLSVDDPFWKPPKDIIETSSTLQKKKKYSWKYMDKYINAGIR